MSTAPFDDAEIDELAAQLLRHLPFAAEDCGDELPASAGAAPDFGEVEEWFHGSPLFDHSIKVRCDAALAAPLGDDVAADFDGDWRGAPALGVVEIALRKPRAQHKLPRLASPLQSQNIG
jgi:hypothetical protein